MMIILWKVDHTYVDAGAKPKRGGYSAKYEFVSWVSIDSTHQNWGINSAGGIRKLSSGKGQQKSNGSGLTPAAIFSMTSVATVLIIRGKILLIMRPARSSIGGCKI